MNEQWCVVSFKKNFVPQLLRALSLKIKNVLKISLNKEKKYITQLQLIS